MTREGRRHPWERAGAVERSGWGGSGASPPDRCRAGLGRDRFVRSSLLGIITPDAGAASSAP
jgi:hypothetical protein